MSSQFDALLDFGDDPPPSANGTAQKTNGSDDFDPFGPGPVDSGKGGASDGGLLLDFSVTTEVRRNEVWHHTPSLSLQWPDYRKYLSHEILYITYKWFVPQTPAIFKKEKSRKNFNQRPPKGTYSG